MTDKFLTNIFIILLFYACSDTKSLALEQSNQQVISTQFTVSGNLTTSSQYCGGAAPTKATIDKYKKRKPFAKASLLLINLNTERTTLDTIQTNQMGNYQLQVPSGSYGLIRDRSRYITRYRRADFNEKDWTCFQNWLNKPDVIFEVTSQDISVDTVNIFLPCVYKEIPCRAFWRNAPR